jgi:hypothetical protein
MSFVSRAEESAMTRGVSAESVKTQSSQENSVD